MKIIAGLVGFALLASGAVAQQTTDEVAPETGSAVLEAQAVQDPLLRAAFEAKAQGQPVEAQRFMVAAANPLAVYAGYDVLAQGGSAADAMVAVQTVLGLVEPQSSGLGGGAFLVWYDAKTQQLTTLDGRETAPLAATPTLFQDAAGDPLGFFEAVVGGRSVGTPGTPALMQEAQARWGRLDWAALFEPAIALAQDGFAVSPRLAEMVARDAERLSRFPDTAAYFLPDGQPLKVGEVLQNPAYAQSLSRLAQEGAAGFYTGPLAQEIVAAVRSAPGNPGVLSEVDLSLYAVRERAPVCVPYRAYEVCGMGPPSSGALSVGQILGILNNVDLSAMDPAGPETWQMIGEASRLAFADRGRYMADQDFVPMPLSGLVDPAYLKSRFELLTPGTALPLVAPGAPEWDHAQLWADDRAFERPSTTHISIVDGAGNVLSMTSTIENAFGSRLMAGGFLLNNELTDFSFRTHVEGVPIANRLAPGKRPRSSMAPTIVLQDGAPVLAIGSPGGSRIIGYVAKALIGWIDWGMNVQEALAYPHLVNRFGTYDLEAGTEAEKLAAPLEQMGYDVNARDLNSGLHAIEITPEGLRGGADPRREGIVLGN